MVKEWVINWFIENASMEGELNLELNFIDEGVIDSFAFINLITDCEERFEIFFDDQDFESMEMLSIKGLVNRIECKL